MPARCSGFRSCRSATARPGGRRCPIRRRCMVRGGRSRTSPRPRSDPETGPGRAGRSGGSLPCRAHAPCKGDFRLTGQLDLGRFLDLIAAEGMYAIVRPGPYICAEWDNGGLPAWLLQSGTTGIRCNEPAYMAAVSDYFQRLAPVLVPRQADRGGPIILVQVENEYGAYGNDHGYLRGLAELIRRIGVTVP